VSVAKIAELLGLSHTRTRGLVREVLARRAPRAPVEFLAAEVSRLNEALRVSFDSMYNEKSGANFEAIEDRSRT
jgi:hypothetical protein